MDDMTSAPARDEAGFPLRFALAALAALAAWRVTHLVAHEDGPADVVVRVRARAGSGWVGRPMDCFYCLCVWVAAPLAARIAQGRGDRVVTWLALSGAACLLERMTAQPPVLDNDHELKGDDHGVLWPEA